MPITYPRTIHPDLLPRESKFEFVHQTTQSSLKSGAALVNDFADGYWMFQIQTRPISQSKVSEIIAWWESLRGGIYSFFAYDFKYPDLATYFNGAVTSLLRFGGGAFNGISVVAALTPTTITIGAVGSYLPTTIQFKAGDKIGLYTAPAATPTRYFVYRVAEDAVAVNGVVTLTLTNPVHTNIFSVGSLVNVVKPVCEFIPDPESWDFKQELTNSPISFIARSRIG